MVSRLCRRSVLSSCGLTSRLLVAKAIGFFLVAFYALRKLLALFWQHSMLCESLCFIRGLFDCFFFGFGALGLKADPPRQGGSNLGRDWGISRSWGNTSAKVLVFPSKSCLIPEVFTHILLGQVCTRPPALRFSAHLMVK